jgi:ferredoxin
MAFYPHHAGNLSACMHWHHDYDYGNLAHMVGKPLFSPIDCMNHPWDPAKTGCTRCHDVCPAEAIAMNGRLPDIDGAKCTACAACVAICPTGAISHEQIRADALLRRARELALLGKRTMRAACSHVSDASADISIPCHAAWNPLLLASLAAEGAHVLELDGISQCAACPVRHGARVMAQTEQDYAALNKALGVRLVISHDVTRPAVDQQVAKQEPEPERRAFFRKLIPSLAQGAAMTVAHISDAMRQDEPYPEENAAVPLHASLRLFLKALTRLQPTFTPVPRLASIPLGNIQADARCSACGQCVEQCPTHALELRPFGTNHVLEFRPDACIGCDHCADICPEHAITPLPSLSLPVVAARRSRPLVMVAAQNAKKNTAVS